MTTLAQLGSVRGLPIVMAVIAAGLWGVWWLPIRFLEGVGLVGVWAGLSMNLGALPILALAVMLVRSNDRLTRQAIAGAALVGLAITFYASALTFTDVVRAVLLFYLAPAWSTAIECLFLGRRWTWRSTLALGLSLAGVIVMFRGDISIAALNVGDMMALASGLSWAVGAALVFTAPPADARHLGLVTCLSAIVVGSGLLLIAGDAAGGLVPDLEALRVAGLSLASGLVYLAPIIVFTLWAARNLPPALFSFLLTAEIISGVVSSAIFLDERFGWPEAIGAVLVCSGAVVEAITNSTGKPNERPDKVEPIPSD
ncbi:MAG: DMT family transporter [Pseudomonadota bacterium]